MTGMVSRRHFLGGIACSAAAHPLVAPVALAAVPGEARLVVIVLRGALDGLGMLPPVGDPLYAARRPGLAEAGALQLAGLHALHPAMRPLLPLWQAGELAFAPAVSTPYRDKRSHFDGQDLLEAGADDTGGAPRDGWLNRLLRVLPGSAADTAWAVGRDEMRILHGAAPVYQWAPDANVEISPQARLLLERLYAPDPLFAQAAAAALDLAARPEADGAERLPDGQAAEPLAAFAAARLRDEARIASYSLSGFDTHRRQAAALPRALDRLQRSILTLRAGLGATWDRTAVLAVTEFGRTVAENGTGGTDHGTGGAMVLAGGAIRGGRLVGRWPGLAEADLYDRRDLMPTDDLRRLSGWVMRALFGLDRAALEATVFPGLDLGDDPALTA